MTTTITDEKMNCCDKFKLLLWKNFTLQKRNKKQTLFEILAPVLITTLLLVVRGLVEPAAKRQVHYEAFSATNLSTGRTNVHYRRSSNELQRFAIPFSPNTDFVKRIVMGAMEDLISENVPGDGSVSQFLTDNVVGLNNAAELRRHMKNPLYANRSICGIEFDGLVEDDSKNIQLTLHFPSELRTTQIRSHFLNWKTDSTFPIFQTPGPRDPNSNTGGIPNYSKEGFVPLAHVLFRRVAMAKNIDFPNVQFKRFPHPPFVHDDFVVALKALMPLVMIICFYNTCVNTVKVIATEKEQQLKEVMKVMGLDCWLHWIAWFIKSYTYILISIILIVILMKVEWFSSVDGVSGYSILTYTPWTFLFFFLLIYTITSVCYCFMISVFFSKASTASTVAGLCWFLSFCPYTILSNKKTLSPFGLRLFSCLASNTAMSFGFEIIFNNEAIGEGLQWSKIWTKISSDDNLVMGHIIIMFVFDAIIYLLIALYVEQVIPGEFGVAQPWNYCFRKEYWMSSAGCGKASNAVGTVPYVETVSNDSNIEPDPKNLKVGLQTINLTKEFKKKVVVDHLNLKVFEGQITIILGHNGAGKTTTMSMLTGIITPTSGTAIVAGHDIRTDITGARSSLGVCPQQNVLFSDLTVEEHIKFYASLKGLKGKKLKYEIEKYLELLGLKDKRRNLSKTLSGGMKRRLGVGVALCGGSKVVILDEPSSGLDPASRKELWDLLQAEKKGRTIIMSTHFMDEAEVLGERVAVMAGGKIRAIGSPFFLKRQFSVGYRLTAATTGGPHNPVTELIQLYIPEATLVTNIGSELSYALPTEVSDKFVPLLRELETSHTTYGLTSFGISVGSLEAVFMKVGADAFETLDENDQMIFKEMGTNLPTDTRDNNDADNKPNISQVEHGPTSTKHYVGCKLWRSQWMAMFKKHKAVTMRSWIVLILQVVISVIFLLIVILVERGSRTSRILPARHLTLSNGYEDSETFVSYRGTLDNVTKTRINMYKTFFEGSPTMNVVDIGNEDMETYYLRKASENMPEMRKKNTAGVTFDGNNIVVWYSNFGFHDQPVSMMLAYNAIVKAARESTTLSLINNPLPFSIDIQMQMLGSPDEQGFQLALNIGFSLAIVSSFYILFYVKANATRSKLLQLTSGASPFILWGSAFVWDVMCFIFVSFSIAITLLIFQETGFSTIIQMMRVIFLLSLFSFAMLPLNYLLADCFTEPASGFSKMCFINFFTGFITFLIVQVLHTPHLKLEDVAQLLDAIFLIVPHYAICIGIKRQYDGYAIVQNCKNLCESTLVNYLPPGVNCNLQTVCNLAPMVPILEPCCMSEDSFFDWKAPGVGAPVLYLLSVAIFSFIILLLKEYQFINILKRKICRPPMLPHLSDEKDDSDVVAEKQKIATMTAEEFSNYVLVCRNMSKNYGSFNAVNRVSFSVGHGECFGLLGINGAGKTTTFQMLTGDNEMSHGEAWVVGYCINDEMEEVRRHMGYCPQFDALLDEMTGRETIELFAGLKGIPEEEREKLTLILSSQLGFIKHIDKLVMEYSGGNKRKLSAAVALLGNPEVVYLDEPTTGMDPLAKRQVWRAVAARQEGCVVLTSHSMEECEALCTRLAIMIKGKFRCLGSPQHLKNKFAQGYTLIVKLGRTPELTFNTSQPDIITSRISSSDTVTDSSEPFHKFITVNFTQAQLTESIQGLLTYFVPNVGVKCSQIFDVMEIARKKFDIEDYSVGQTSLEQIFLQFTQEQDESTHM